MAAAACFAAALAADPPAAASQIRLEELAASASGVGFELRHEPTPRKRMIETMAGGLAVFDYDGDGRADIFFANGADEATMRKTSPAYFNRLYRNEGGLRFADVTREAGIAGAGYSMGAAAADFDNDGDTDLFVAGVFISTLCTAISATELSRTLPKRPASPAESGPSPRAGSTSTATACWTSLSSTTPTGRSNSTATAATGTAVFASTAIRSTSHRSPTACTAISGRAGLRTGPSGPVSRARRAAG